MVDTVDSKSTGSNPLSVRVRPSVHMFEIDKKFNIHTNQYIPAKYAVQNPGKEWLASVIESSNLIYQSYKKSVLDDGRLLGIEKNELKQYLESIFTNLISFLRSFDAAATSHPITADLSSQVFLEFNSQFQFQINGKISPHELSRCGDFNNWFNEKFNPKLKIFISSIGESLLDGEIDEEEKTKIKKSVYEILEELIYMIINLEYSDIKR